VSALFTDRRSNLHRLSAAPKFDMPWAKAAAIPMPAVMSVDHLPLSNPSREVGDDPSDVESFGVRLLG
jgi:hypothetical protein